MPNAASWASNQLPQQISVGLLQMLAQSGQRDRCSRPRRCCRLASAWTAAVLAAADRSQAGNIAPDHGLVLESVTYSP